MKLHSLKVQHFRAIENSTFDFTDNISKPKQMNLIVGPNGSGKTSILDAIHIVVRTLENPLKPRLREALEFSVSQLVRGKQAKIEFEYSIEENEAHALNEVFHVLNKNEPFRFNGDEPPLMIPANDVTKPKQKLTRKQSPTRQSPKGNRWCFSTRKYRSRFEPINCLCLFYDLCLCRIKIQTEQD
jgi:predicted ATPase